MDAKQATTTPTKSRAANHEQGHHPPVVAPAAASSTSMVSLKKNQQQGGSNGKDSSVISSSLPPQLSPPSPPSLSTSPTHEFSFTISLHHAPISTTSTTTKNSSYYPDNKACTGKLQAASSPSSFAIDLSPADDIFFHGHLLPLHLLSHFPVSPRTSTTSIDSFTLPIKEIFHDNRTFTTKSNPNIIINNNNPTKPRPKSKSFSLFRRFRKGNELNEAHQEKEQQQRQKKKPRFDVGHVIKRYIRLVRPLLLFRVRRRRKESFQMRGNGGGTGFSSYSGNLASKTKQVLRGKRGERSAPASMRTSPTNSGLLVAGSTSIASSTSDSTMEELHAAIQAAIAHCKKSIAVEDKLKVT